MSQQRPPPPPQQHQPPQGFVAAGAPTHPPPMHHQQPPPPMGVVVGMPAGGPGGGPPSQPPPPTILQRPTPPGGPPANNSNHANSNNNHNRRPANTSNPNTGIPYGHVPGYLPGSSSLVEELDQRLLIVLRDGRHVLGVLRTFDQFSNMVLQDAVERKIHYNSKDKCTYYADLDMTGLYVVRGDAMVLMGQVPPDDNTDEQDSSINMKRIDMEDLDVMIQSAKEESKGGEPAAPSAGSGEEPTVLEWDFDKDLLA